MWDCVALLLLLHITTMITELQLSASTCIFFVIVSALGQDLLSCQVTSPVASSNYPCSGNKQQDQCSTFAVLRTNSYYSSLYNLSSYLGISPFSISEANGFSAGTEFLPNNQPLLIPIECRCNDPGGFFEAELTKTSTRGETFYGIAQSLEGLTTCKAIQDKNPTFSPWNVEEKQILLVPLKCACPSSAEIAHQIKLLLSYPASEGDTLADLALRFNTTPESIISLNNRSGAGFVFKSDSLVPFSTLLIPAETKPVFGSLANLREPRLPVSNPEDRKSKMGMIGVYIAIGTVAFVSTISIGAAFLFIQWRRKKQHGSFRKNGGDLELQQLSLSVRTTSEKKVSFEGSNDDSLNGRCVDTASTVHESLVETYTLEELKKAAEDFSSTNLIEDSVFHGRLSGKNLAIKRTSPETISKIEFALFYDAIHNHPNIMRLLGTCCTTEGRDSYIVFEYAKNGSLKDWLHGGLAMKSHFIASCNCFLSWSQRVRICLDVATALQFMHQVMNPAYVHRNIKSRNIFIDEEFNAKVGNFGMARCVEDRAEDGSRSDRGQGYLAPEYVEQGVVAPSIDVFALGVVLLEALSGRTPVRRASEKGDDEWVCLSQEIKLILESEDADELREWMDKAVGENYSFDAAVTLANLARACVEDDPSLRPNAAEIVDKLSRLVVEAVGGDGDHQFGMCDSSSKPLVKAAAAANVI